MKKKVSLKPVVSLLALGCAMNARADVIYSGQQNLAIPNTLNGLYLNVLTGSTSTSGWQLNASFGGIDVYNTEVFQPVRVGTSSVDPILNLGQHTIVNSSSTYDLNSEYGASEYNLTDGTFTAGQEGYLGFKVTNGTETYFGWMRVVFTGTGTALIKDWAYDTTAGSIGVGNVLQNGDTFTLDSTAQGFILGSAIGGTNKVVVQGSYTVSTSTAHTYSGTTSINGGTFALTGGGSIANSSIITVGSGATFDVSAVTGGWTLGSLQTLTGSGSVTGNATIAGTHNAGLATVNSGVGTQSFSGNLTYQSGSVYQWDLATSALGTRGTDYDGVNVGGSLSGDSGAIFKVVLGSGSFGDTFWDTNQTWTDIFKNGTSSLTIEGVFGNSAIQWWEGGTNVTSLTEGQGYFSISGTSLNWTAVPEPTSALAGLLLGVGFLRRRRQRS